MVDRRNSVEWWNQSFLLAESGHFLSQTFPVARHFFIFCPGLDLCAVLIVDRFRRHPVCLAEMCQKFCPASLPGHLQKCSHIHNDKQYCVFFFIFFYILYFIFGGTKKAHGDLWWAFEKVQKKSGVELLSRTLVCSTIVAEVLIDRVRDGNVSINLAIDTGKRS